MLSDDIWNVLWQLYHDQAARRIFCLAVSGSAKAGGERLADRRILIPRLTVHFSKARAALSIPQSHSANALRMIGVV